MRKVFFVFLLLSMSTTASDVPTMKQCSISLAEDENASLKVLTTIPAREIDRDARQMALCAAVWDGHGDQGNALRALKQAERYSSELHDRMLAFLRHHNLETVFWQEDRR
ncbi:MAG TPA: hypothetical protein VKQ11_06635 [Candidatus Sulfotelmatobacter sp.]|nr:hypothetical protein [Candidatus Sulfotelmatobacter sp.]